jgi:hypothetical protein
MQNLTDIQQAFVRRYMHDDGVVGVRVRKLEGQMVLFVEIDEHSSVQLPDSFRGVPVVVRSGRRAILAYA